MTLPMVGRRGDGAMSLLRPQLRIAPATAGIVLAAAFVPIALAHGGHEENKIPEGETISLDPLVRWFGRNKE